MCGVVGHSPTACAKKVLAAAAASPSEASTGSAQAVPSCPVEVARGPPAPEDPSGFGPWMNVQRRRPKAANGPVQDKASAVRRGEAARGSRYAVLVNDDVVTDATVSNVEGNLVGAPVGFGQKLNLFSFNGTGQTSNKVRAPKVADRPRKAPQTAKGKNILAQLPVTAERPPSMESLEGHGEASTLLEIPPSDPPDIVMDPEGKEESTGPRPNETELVAPALGEAQDDLTGSPVAV
ncbi:hypothetical protein K2173_023024 [Erythroxylum novogranatense]|uniref:Uncharacterized protein n=1 Tax=Erythroxylum novogranatense TaxID=1862640 RepID=A0AAV8T822_9ROSI|nr:hypothetical protein K2173_023024 [Erythroxylum novogranatense]